MRRDERGVGRRRRRPATAGVGRTGSRLSDTDAASAMTPYAQRRSDEARAGPTSGPASELSGDGPRYDAAGAVGVEATGRGGARRVRPTRMRLRLSGAATATDAAASCRPRHGLGGGTTRLPPRAADAEPTTGSAVPASRPRLPDPGRISDAGDLLRTLRISQPPTRIDREAHGSVALDPDAIDASSRRVAGRERVRRPGVD